MYNCERVCLCVCANARACVSMCTCVYVHACVVIMHGQLRHYFLDGDWAVLQSRTCMYRSSAPVMDLYV